MSERIYKTVVIGGGPAGTGLLFNAIKKKQLKQFLDSGVAFIEKTDDLGCGTIGKYIINSDSEGRVFLECLENTEDLLFKNSELKEMMQLIASYSYSSIPLQWVGNYLKLVGAELKKQIQQSRSSILFSRSKAISICKNRSGEFLTKVKTVDNGYVKESLLRSESVVFAMGGGQNLENIINSPITGSLNLKNYRAKIILTDTLFTDQGILTARNMIFGSKNKKIVVIGSSHSALSSIGTLLNKTHGFDFEENDITLLHRSKFKLFYPTKEQAWNEGYHDFTDNDICPISQRVNRLGGIRLESGQLLKKIMGIHKEKEKRVQPIKICSEGGNSIELKTILDSASLIIPAFGYRPRTVPLYNENNMGIEFFCKNKGPLVNNDCQVMDMNGKAITGLYGIGLASGFIPHGKLGGEPGFKGQTNGLWLYQNGIGEIIFDQLMNRPQNQI